MKNGLFGLVLLLASGCGFKDEEDGSGGSRKGAREVSSDDFTAAAASPLPSSEVIDQLEDFDEIAKTTIYKRPGASFMLGDLVFPDCDEAVASTDLITASGDYLEWDYASSAGGCLEKSLGKGFDSVSATVDYQYFMSIKCTGADFSALNGAKMQDLMSGSIDDLEQTQLASCNKVDGSFEKLMKISMAMTLDATVEGKDPIHLDQVMVDADMALDGGPCRATVAAGQVKVDDCLKLKRTTVNVSDGSEPDPEKFKSGTIVMRATLTGLTGPNDSRYWQAGEIPIEVGDWKGTVTLDGSSTPEYVVSKQDKEWITGRLGQDEGVVSKTPPHEYPDEEAPEEDPTFPEKPDFPTDPEQTADCIPGTSTLRPTGAPSMPSGNESAVLVPSSMASYKAVIGGNGLSARGSGDEVAVASASFTQSAGLHYFEVVVAASNCLHNQFVGVGTEPTLGLEMIETNARAGNPTTFPGMGQGACFYSSSGRVICDGLSANEGEQFVAFSAGDVIGIAVDVALGRAYFSRNGAWINGRSPASGDWFSFQTSGKASAFVGLDQADEMVLNFGGQSFHAMAPSGFQPGWFRPL